MEEEDEEEGEKGASPGTMEIGEDERVPLLFVDVNLGTDG